MPKTHVTTTSDADLAEALDRFVANRPRNDRTDAMEAALAEKVSRFARTLLARDEAAAVAICAPRYDELQYRGATMPKTKVAVTLDEDLVDELDGLVSSRRFNNRSQAIEEALAEKLGRLARTRLARESAKLDPAEERALAEEGLAASRDTWPEY